jgi:hypothetical protein
MEIHGIYRTYCKDGKIKITKQPKNRYSPDDHEQSDIEVQLKYNPIYDEYKSYQVSESELELIASETSTDPIAPPKRPRIRKSAKYW